MGFVLILLAIATLIAILVWTVSDEGDRATGIILSTVICVLVSGVIMALIWGQSYNTYLSLKQRLVIIEQYRSTVAMYSDKGVLEFKKHEKGGFERIGDLTDFKYQNYQLEMARMIKDLRTVTAKYNNSLVGKRVMKANWFWNWCIISPDSDMEPLRMIKSTRPLENRRIYE